MKTSVTTMIVGAGSAQISAGTVRDLCVNPGLHDIPQIAFFLEVARDKECLCPDRERLCPDAWLIQPANPMFEVCTLMAREKGIKALGLCHGRSRSPARR